MSNGRPLRANVHTLFNLKLVGVDVSTMRICVVPKLAGSISGELTGKPLAARPG